MKKSLISVLFFIFILNACTKKTTNILELDNSLSANQNIVAQIAEKPIYQIELDNYVKSRTQKNFSDLNTADQNKIFEQFMQLEILSHTAVEEKHHESDNFQIELHNLKKNLLAQALVNNFEQKNTITEIDLAAQYEIVKSAFEVPQLKVRNILLKTEEEAKQVIVELNNGKIKFTDLAQQKSIGPSRQNGGDLDWFTPAQMSAAFSHAALKLEIGSFSQEPVKTELGYYVLLKEDERIGVAPSLENLRPRLEQQIKKKRLEKYITDLRENLNIVNNLE